MNMTQPFLFSEVLKKIILIRRLIGLVDQVLASGVDLIV